LGSWLWFKHCRPFSKAFATVRCLLEGAERWWGLVEGTGGRNPCPVLGLQQHTASCWRQPQQAALYEILAPLTACHVSKKILFFFFFFFLILSLHKEILPQNFSESEGFGHLAEISGCSTIIIGLSWTGSAWRPKNCKGY